MDKSTELLVPEVFECVICFDEIRQGTPLPCNCKVSYCMRCWDKALAASLNQGDVARCPTCRGPVRVDFDADTCRLTFSRDAELPVDSGETGEVAAEESRRLVEEIRALMERGPQAEDSPEVQDLMSRLVNESAQGRLAQYRQQTIERLAEQAVPAMLRILEEYHAKHSGQIASYLASPADALAKEPIAELRHQLAAQDSIPDGLEDDQVASRLVEASENAGAMASFLISAQLQAPLCVCGSSLERVATKERSRRFVMRQMDCPADSRRVEEVLARYEETGSSDQICDLCENIIPIRGFTWTCKNEDATILHANTYDICDLCFTQHACGVRPR